MRLTRRRWLIASTLFAALVVVVSTFGLSEALRYAHAPQRIEVQATPIDAFDPRDTAKARFGQLEFRGGLMLTSSSQAFGGISALYMEPDGAHFLSVTDQGSWLRGRIVYRRPAGVADAEMAPLLCADGRPLAARHWYDTESLAQGADGMFYVAIERVEKIVRFDYRRDGLRARAANSGAGRL